MTPKIPAFATGLALLMAGVALPAHAADSGATMDGAKQPMSDNATGATSSGSTMSGTNSMTTVDLTDLRPADDEGDKAVTFNGRTLEELKDTDIETTDGKSIGEVDEVLIDKGKEVKAVTVNSGGFLGIGGEKVVVPTDKLSYNSQSKKFVVAMNEEEVKALPNWGEDKSKAMEGGRGATGTTGTSPTY